MGKKLLFFVFLICSVTVKLNAQQNVSISDVNTLPDASSVLDVSSTTKGLLVPRVALTSTTNQSPIPNGITVATALLVYNTATSGDVTPGFYHWANNKWNRFDTGNNIGDWKLLGNAGTNAGTNFLGTTDAADLVFRTNNTERIRTLGSNGKVGIGTSAPTMRLDVTDASTTASDATIRGAATGNAATYGILGTSSSATGQGVFGFNFNASGTGVIGAGNNLFGQYLAGGSGGAFTSSNAGVYGYGNNTVASYGVWGVSVNSTGVGVVGQANTSTGVNLGILGITNSSTGDGLNAINYAALGTGDGNGLFSTTAQSLGFGAWGTNTNTSGTGVVGGGQAVLNSSYLTVGSGGAFTGRSIGVAGFASNSGNGNWGGYFTNGNANGFAYVGGRIGGTDYKINGPGTVSTIVKNLEGEFVNMYCPESPEILFQDFGNGTLENGFVHVELDRIFAKNVMINEKHPLRVFIQVEGDCNGVYVRNKNSFGFDVVELNGGTSNTRFTYFVIANRADGETINGVPGSRNADTRFGEAPQEMQKLEKKIVEIKNIKSKE
jgi:hypothetical protein